MRAPLLLTILCFAAAFTPLGAQEPRAGKYEVRAVWLTTLLGLDWPSPALAGDAEAQKQSLREILDDIRRMHFTTVMFQVRSRGNAMFRSEREPWAGELTGSLGGDPGWDPLEFAVEEAHLRGLEIHAWVNVCRLWTGGSLPPRASPEHLCHAHPEWVKPFKEEYWLDPGIPNARRFTVQLCEELVRRYDIDGLHLDYIRYPDLSFDDQATFARYGGGKEKGEWRRENINELVRDIYSTAVSLKPWLNVGSAPIGIYQNLPTAKGWQGYFSVSQDARRWLREGYQDYVAPQIYWGLRSRGSSIDFEALARDWKQGAAGRHVYAGIAAYRPEVAKYIEEHVDACRRIGVEGSCYFRYSFTRGEGMFRHRYDTRSIPPSEAWKPNPACPAVHNLAVQESGGRRRVSWQSTPSATEGAGAARFVVYRASSSPVDISNPGNIAAILPASQIAFVEDTPGNWFYAVTALNRYNIESRPVQEGIITSAPAALALPGMDRSAISESVLTPDSSLVLLGYRVGSYGRVRLKLVNDEGRELATVIDENMEPGTYIIGIERRAGAPLIAGYVFECGEYRIRKSFAR